MHVKARNRPQQRAQIGVPRPAEDIVERAAFHDLAAIHHDDFLGDIGDHPEIVGDQQHGHSELALQLDEQLQDLRLNRYIECGRRLVRDQQRPDNSNG